jgi:hypothetical protein
LALVHAKGDRQAPFVLRELQEIKDMCEFERRNADVTYLELFKPNMINRTHIGIFTQIWSQLTGYVKTCFIALYLLLRLNHAAFRMNVMMYYITYVFGKEIDIVAV